MKLKKSWLTACGLILAMVAGLITTAAQEPKRRTKDGGAAAAESGNVTVYSRATAGPAQVAEFNGGNVFVIGSSLSFELKLVKGAPFSADSVTETVQTLADGNRIVRRESATTYRDGEGRTRREQTLAAVGPWSTAGESAKTIFINDPATGVNYVLDQRSHVAHKINLPNLDAMKEKLAAMKGDSEEARAHAEGPHAGQVLHVGPHAGQAEVKKRAAAAAGGAGKSAVKESLGTQTIEGVTAEGTRVTVTIPAGAIGNEQPIQIVDETWYSPELQVIVMSRHSDPRLGETTYRLTNINRAEPDHSLFEVPSDYTIQEEKGGVRVEMRRKQEQ